MATILVTGAGGYIGSIASQLFLAQGHTVVGVDAFLTGYKGPLDLVKHQYPDTFTWHEAHIADAVRMGQVLDTLPPIDVVVHYAASCVVKESMRQPEKYFENNVHTSLRLLELMRVRGIRNIVFSSTCAVYGAVHYHPIDEHHPISPTNPYGDSKRMVELMMQWYTRVHGLSAFVMRYFNVYGTSDDRKLGYAKKPCTHLVDAAVQGALGLHEFRLTCGSSFDTPDGTPIRDYLHVVDLNEAHVLAVKALLKSNKPQYEVINLGTGSGNTVLEMVELVEAETGTKLPRDVGEVREGEDAVLVADNKKAYQLLGWKPKRNIRASIPAMIEWYKNHPHGWE